MWHRPAFVLAARLRILAVARSTGAFAIIAREQQLASATPFASWRWVRSAVRAALFNTIHPLSFFSDGVWPSSFESPAPLNSKCRGSAQFLGAGFAAGSLRESLQNLRFGSWRTA
jgi:hypothetical protein